MSAVTSRSLLGRTGGQESASPNMNGNEEPCDIISKAKSLFLRAHTEKILLHTVFEHLCKSALTLVFVVPVRRTESFITTLLASELVQTCLVSATILLSVQIFLTMQYFSVCNG